MRTIVIGLGNPILGDDGVGWRVAEEVMRMTCLVEDGGSLDIERLSLGGISLMEHLIGYDRAFLIDACFSNEEPGTIIVSKLEELPDVSASHTTSVHDTSLQNAMKLGKSLGAQLPEDVTIIGISARRVYDFNDELSPPVKGAVPKAAQLVMERAMQNITIH